MSWDGYIDSLITNGQGAISKATIVGLNGAIWTPKTKDSIINISQAEASCLAGAVSKGDVSPFRASGVTLEQTKYMFLRDINDDGKNLVCKKAGLGNLTIQATNQAIIIAFTPDGGSAGNANSAVNGIAQYLMGLGY